MKQALSMILARVFLTLMRRLTTMAVGHRLGSAGLGDVSLIVLAIALSMLLNDVVGGGARVYFTPRLARAKLLAPSCTWAALTMGAATIVLRALPLVPDRYETAVLVLTGMQ